ncbi:MAG: MarP family serine protease [Candidatus Nanopelagicales bacterium]
MNLVDVILGVSILVAVNHGWRLGIIRGVFGFAGMLAGGWIALQTVPLAIDAFTLSTAWRIASGVGLVAAAAVAGEIVGNAVGSAIRRTIRWSPVQFLDSLLGSAFRLTSLTVIVWLLTSAMAVLPDRGVVHLVRTSGIIRIIDEYAPDAAGRATAALRRAMRSSSFPEVFAGITPQPQQSIEPPDPRILSAAPVRATYGLVFKVEADAELCSERMSGTGFVYAPNRIITNAHVVAGATRVTVTANNSSTPYPAEVVFFDPRLDVAVLDVPALHGGELSFGGPGRTGETAAIPGYTGGDPLSPDPARIADVILARGHDIYGGSRVDREIFVLRAHVAAGDSGAPVVAADGSVLGMVFAAATDQKDVGYALTADAIAKAADQGRSNSTPVTDGHCID